MVNNISGITPTQNNTSRGREKPQGAAEQAVSVSQSAKPSSDKVDLSNEAKKLQDIEAGLKRLPEVDRERVSHIKDTLRDGNYSVDPQRLAAKIAQFELDI
ncbi:MAG: negative regulator of flagellin synthesis FlgM [Candidatus Azotimanducaceae bacterium]|jgi:negative regulator of flagellin synthesis FlgM